MLALIFVLQFLFGVAVKEVIADPAKINAFLNIAIFPIGLIVVSVGATKILQDMHFRKSGTLLAVTQRQTMQPKDKLLPKQGLAYLGSDSFALGLASFFFYFALTSPFPTNINLDNSALEIVIYILALAFLGLGTLIAAKRKAKIQQPRPAQYKNPRSEIPWITHSNNRRQAPIEKATVRHSTQRK